MSNYAHPDAVVSNDWLAENKDKVVIVEVDVDTTAYEEGHIPGAIAWNWTSQLSDNVQRDILGKEDFEKLMQESGISPDTTVVLYGDNHNWFAAWAFWQMKIFGHKDVRLLNGGRKKWLMEGREMVTSVPSTNTSSYEAPAGDYSLRAYMMDVRTNLGKADTALVDVRSGAEFTGEVLAPAGLPETCQRGGHIPGAKNIGWGTAANDDGTFKSVEDLKSIYEGQGVTSDKNVVTYCRIGERSSLSWFVLKYLLGYENVQNYDGSWTEWGNLVGAPIEK